MIETDFLARTLEHMPQLRTIATTQKLRRLRSAQVLMSEHDPAPLSMAAQCHVIVSYSN